MQILRICFLVRVNFVSKHIVLRGNLVGSGSRVALRALSVPDIPSCCDPLFNCTEFTSFKKRSIFFECYQKNLRKLPSRYPLPPLIAGAESAPDCRARRSVWMDCARVVRFIEILPGSRRSLFEVESGGQGDGHVNEGGFSSCWYPFGASPSASVMAFSPTAERTQ